MEKKKRISLFLSVFALALLVSLLFFALNQQKPNDDFAAATTFAMSTVVEQKWYGKEAQRTLDEVNTMLLGFENQISVYVPGSEIAAINASAGIEWTDVSDTTYALLKEAKELSKQSYSTFDITVGPLVELWGITTDKPHVPAQKEIAAAVNRVDFSKLQLREQESKKQALLTENGMAIDMGGIAKGMAADMVRQIAEKNGVKGYASLGGNLVVLGKKSDGSDYRFGLRNPRGAATEYIGVLTLEGKTMATTGDYERYFEQNGKRYHHILSPQTGAPVETDLISLTVVSEDGTLADYLSTTLFSLGLKSALQCMHRSDFDIIAVDRDYNVYVSQGLGNKFVFDDESGQFHLVAH